MVPSDGHKVPRFVKPACRKPSRLSGSIRLNPPQIQLDYDKNKNTKRNFRLELPNIPDYTMQLLGKRFILDLWEEILKFDVQFGGLITLGELRSVFEALTKLGYSVPFKSLVFDMDEEDFVAFDELLRMLTDIISSKSTSSSDLNLKLDQPLNKFKIRIAGCRDIVVNDNPQRLCICCSCNSCICEYSDDGFRDVAEKDYSKSDSHRLTVIFNRMSLDKKSKLRIKDICEILAEAEIPFDKKRKPDSFWKIQGDFYLVSTEQLIEIATCIRTDRDEVIDFNYNVPLWLKKEFSKPEIIMFRHRFQVADVDHKSCLTPEKFRNLIDSLGLKLTMETSERLVRKSDMRGVGSITFAEFLGMMYKIEHGAIKIADDSHGHLHHVIAEAKRQTRVFEEIEQVNDLRSSDNDVEAVQSNPISGVRINRYGGYPVSGEFIVEGPPGSLYEGGEFKVIVTFDNGYPYVPPTCKFLTRIININIYSQTNGDGILTHLQSLWDAFWDVERLLIHVKELLSAPRLEYVLDHIKALLRVLVPARFFEDEQPADRRAMDAESAGGHPEEGDAYLSLQGEDADTDTDNPDTLLPANDMSRDLVEADQVPAHVPKQADDEPLSTAGNDLIAATAEAMRTLRKMDLVHFQLCHMYLTDRDKYNQHVRRFVEQFALPKS